MPDPLKDSKELNLIKGLAAIEDSLVKFLRIVMLLRLEITNIERLYKVRSIRYKIEDFDAGLLIE